VIQSLSRPGQGQCKLNRGGSIRVEQAKKKKIAQEEGSIGQEEEGRSSKGRQGVRKVTFSGEKKQEEGKH